ncbi:MAG: hypothetical protein U0441_12905 [Polyangiaceae bacterium]
MEQPVIQPKALDAQISAAPRAAPDQIATPIERPEGEPTLRAETPFATYEYWQSATNLARVWTVRGAVVERVDVSDGAAQRQRSPLPAIGSPVLHDWLARNDFFAVSPSAAAPWSEGVLFARRAEEQPGGMFWLGALDRASLPPISARMLDFEDDEAWCVGPEHKLTLEGWPRCAYRGHDLEIRGAWHDWKLVLTTQPDGVWTYATLSEQMDFVAGEITTWLEILAHDEALRRENKLPVEIALLVPEGAAEELARALALTKDTLRTDARVASLEGEHLWIRVQKPPIGRSFAIARCASPDDAARFVEAALALPGAAPSIVALSTWSAEQPRMREILTARGLRVKSSAAMWWGELTADE